MNNTAKLPLNAGQTAASEDFFKFLFDKHQKEMGISGPGGVGKTFTMAHMIDEIMPRYFQTCSVMGERPLYDSVEMTATTNKAAEVLARATGRPASTYHSLQGLIVKTNYGTGEQTLAQSRNFSILQNKVIFIDEASMVDRQLRKYILEGTHQCKIVYVGDENQLLPVKESESPVYASGIPTSYLTEQMRTNIPELQALHQQLRDTVSGKTGFLPIKVIPGIIDWVDNDQMIAELESHFSTKTDARVVAYTNRQVVDYNNYIRGINGLEGEFQIGEQLVSNSAVTLNREDRLSIEQEVTIVDADSTTRKVIITPDIELEVRDTVLDLGYGGTTEAALPVNYDYFNQVVNYFAKQKNWKQHYELKETYPELRAMHACTVHKSQGSSYDTIFIDAGDLSNCRVPDMVARLLYVAVSRARFRVVFYGELASKFGGLVR